MRVQGFDYDGMKQAAPPPQVAKVVCEKCGAYFDVFRCRMCLRPVGTRCAPCHNAKVHGMRVTR